MRFKNTKWITIFTIIFFFYSCAGTKTTTYVSPYEKHLVPKAKTIVVETKAGETFILKAPSINDQILAGYTKDKEKKEILLSSVKSVRIEKTDKGLYVVYGGASLVFAWLFIGMTTAPAPPPTECCPFVYSFDGDDYHFDAEPYGAAICEGLKRTEWSELEHLKNVNGEYRLLVTNELNETQFTDEVKLLVVDHPDGVEIAPDATGRIHTIAEPNAPIKVHNSTGEDVSHFFSKKDGDTWQSPFDETDPDNDQTLREELTFEFPKPSDAKKAKLIVNARTSQWGAQMGRRFLDLYGNTLPDWYEEMDNHGPAFFRTWSWYLQEELYLMQIRVKLDKGWKSLGTLYGSGPFVSKDKAYALDISDVSGDTLKIKLTPPVNFWNIDYVAVDYTEDLPVKAAEIEASKAITHKGEDVLDKLKAADKSYYVMPNIGDSVEMIFPAPPVDENSDRTILLKACGYYTIHLDSAMGDQQKDMLERLYNEHDFSIRFAKQEFIKWKKGQDEN